MKPWMIAALIRPFVMLVLAITVLRPARMAVEKYMKESKLKRLLLRRTN